MATRGRQQQQQQGKGSGDSFSPDRTSSIRALPPKKSVMRPMNFSSVMEWYLPGREGGNQKSYRHFQWGIII
jgi:hypothetical protein